MTAVDLHTNVVVATVTESNVDITVNNTPTSGVSTVPIDMAVSASVLAASGSYYTNTGATGLVTASLPTAAAGLKYTFVVTDADGFRIQAAAGDTIKLDSATSGVAGYVQSAQIGAVIELYAPDTSGWIATYSKRVWSIS